MSLLLFFITSLSTISSAASSGTVADGGSASASSCSIACSNSNGVKSVTSCQGWSNTDCEQACQAWSGVNGAQPTVSAACPVGGASASSGGATLVDYDPCGGRNCGDVCNNCQLGEVCASVVNYCDPNGACVPNNSFECLAPVVTTQAPAPVLPTRHPLVRIRCGSQPQASCYGLSADLTAEYDGVCGWSAQQNRCVVVSIGEEGKEGAMCQMHRTIAACNGGGLGGFGRQIVPPMGMMGEGIDNVCAWNPFTNSCKDGQLENEAGDGAGFGFASFDVCSRGTNPQQCPMPYCSWNPTLNGGQGGCVPGLSPNLKKAHAKQKNAANGNDVYLLAGVAGSAFLFGIGLTFIASRWCLSKSSFQEPLHLGTV